VLRRCEACAPRAVRVPRIVPDRDETIVRRDRRYPGSP
jgi:hypothetical protein